MDTDMTSERRNRDCVYKAERQILDGVKSEIPRSMRQTGAPVR